MGKEEIRDEFCRLREVYKAMVGTLYPSIAYRDLCALIVRYERAGGHRHDLPYILPPRADGSVNYMA